MYIGKITPSFSLSFKPFLFYHRIPQRSLISVVLHGSDLLIYNHLDAFPDDSEVALMAFLFSSPIIPSRLRIMHKDLCAKPWQPTSIR